jgi:hypothetical protein
MMGASWDRRYKVKGFECSAELSVLHQAACQQGPCSANFKKIESSRCGVGRSGHGLRLGDGGLK